MPAALIQICVDPRLNHEIIRLQVRQRLGRSGLRADLIYLLNEQGGNPGPNFRNTALLLQRVGEPIVFCGVLHHDDCLAAQVGERTELTVAIERLAGELKSLGLECPLVSGQIRTAHSEVLWSDEPERRYVPFSFGPG